MTTIPLELEALMPGTTEASESQNETGLMGGRQSIQTEELTHVEFSPSEAYSQFQPREVNETSTNFGSAAHEQIQIGSLLDSRLRMRDPLTLAMEQEGEFYIAKCEELNEFGYGPDPISAVQDVRNTIAELYWELKGNQERLGSDLASTWQRLSDLVYEA